MPQRHCMNLDVLAMDAGSSDISCHLRPGDRSDEVNSQNRPEDR